MSELVKISAVGLAGGLLALTMRKERQEFALVITLVTSIIIAGQVISSVGELLYDIEEIVSECGVDINILLCA